MESKEVSQDERTLHLADAASIVQANQKDSQIENILNGKLTELLMLWKGQLFTNVHTKHISIISKLVYLSLTTLVGRKTLGEEYVDIFIVNKSSKGLVKKYQRLIFVLGYSLGPFLIRKLIKMWKLRNISSDGDDSDDDSDATNDNIISIETIINCLFDVHMLLFYFKGAYYDISRRVSGLRYVTGHRLTNNEKQLKEKNSNTYKILGTVLLLQSISTYMSILKTGSQILLKTIYNYGGKTTQDPNAITDKTDKLGTIRNVPDDSKSHHFNLSDKDCFKFIPDNSRKCILCLSDMTDPSCAPCGHLYCWKCIINWCGEKEECPLCRQICRPQQVIPLR